MKFNVLGARTGRSQTAVPNVAAMPKTPAQNQVFYGVVLASNQPTEDRKWTAEEILAREG